ncbi:MAG: AMP-binding protein [Holosporales bacterium]|jgi:acetyl-CoA synthetase|nr:AMP-binding protein [Holosporales bacterium]
MTEQRSTMTKPNKNPLIDEKSYREWYASSFSDEFWLKQAQSISWINAPTVADRSCFASNPQIRWFEDGTLNVCYNCVDRHLQNNADKTAIIFEPDEPGRAVHISYRELHRNVCKLANTLKSLGVEKGDVVTVYLPMDPSIIYAMLACARIGAIHAVVFSGFASHALADRLAQSGSKVVITKTDNQRGGRTIKLRDNVDNALAANEAQKQNTVTSIILMDEFVREAPGEKGQACDSNSAAGPGEYNAPSAGNHSAAGPVGHNAATHTNIPVIYFHNRHADERFCPCEEMSALDPLFVLYTSGSTGRPKGVVHSSGGYITYTALTHRVVFDLQPDDVYFCTADIGWITGHSYGVYGPLANGATLVLFQGIPTYPDAGRFWRIIDEHKVSIFYTAPTALRSLIKLGDEFVRQASLSTLRVLGSVGEPIDLPTWQWFYELVGHSNCPIMDTWWQTESGGVLICPLLSQPQKPGCATKPFAGVAPAIKFIAQPSATNPSANVSEYVGSIAQPSATDPSTSIAEYIGSIAQHATTNPSAKENCISPASSESEARGSLELHRSWPGQCIGVLNDPLYFQQAYFKDGVYVSGDGARTDSDGDFWILGRMDDVLNVSGHRLNSAELEQAVTSLPAIAETCVVGAPHDIKGQCIVVFVVLRKGERSDDVATHVTAQLRKEIGPIASPDRVVVVAELPKTRSGKIVRRLLRKLVAGDNVASEDTSMLLNPDALATIEAALHQK